MNTQSYDIIIVGGGAAACSAGLFCARRGMKTLLLAKEFGGQTASTAEIENYPGVSKIEGPQLMECFKAQAGTAGCELLFDEVLRLKIEHEAYRIETVRGSYFADALILAYGKSPRKLAIEYEDYFYKKGKLIYGSIANGAQYSGYTVGVIGGGNSALTAIGQLAEHVERIFLIHRGSEYRGEGVLIDRLNKVTQCQQLLNARVIALHGTEHLEGVQVLFTDSNVEKKYPLDMIVVAIGFENNSTLVKDFLDCDSTGAIVVDTRCATSREGVFAAGDCTTIPYQQIVISAGEGAKAAISACQYICGKRGRRLPLVDWGFLR